MTSGLLVLAGLLLAVLGLVGLVRGRLGRGLRNRTTSALAVAVGLVVALAAGAVSPAVSDTLAAPAGASSHGAPATRPVRGAPATTPVRGSGATTRPATPSPTPTPRPPTTPAGTTTSPTVAPAPPGPSARAGTALAALAALPVKGRAPRTGYDRGLFGQAWADTDRNGCDTRNDILRRDLSPAIVKPGTYGCLVLGGVLHDPYGGTTISFVRGIDTSMAVQIDHVVALADAWQKGAQGLTFEARRALANDPLNLLAVDGRLNMQKGAGDAATWLPPSKAIRQQYVACQIAVKLRYGLWVTSAEKAAMARVLAARPRTPLPASARPLASPTRSAPPRSAPTTPRTEVWYANCTAVRAAGKAPLLRGQPGYASHLDRDNDGVACE